MPPVVERYAMSNEAIMDVRKSAPAMRRRECDFFSAIEFMAAR